MASSVARARLSTSVEPTGTRFDYLKREIIALYFVDLNIVPNLYFVDTYKPLHFMDEFFCWYWGRLHNRGFL